jgi:hypothetical protein
MDFSLLEYNLFENSSTYWSTIYEYVKTEFHTLLHRITVLLLQGLILVVFWIFVFLFIGFYKFYSQTNATDIM